MPTQNDLLFGSLAASRKFARPEHVSECLQIQANAEGSGARRSLGEIMVAKGYLTPEQVAQILELQCNRGQERALGPYVLTGKLGQGGMGTVFKARLKGTQIDLALKVLPEKMVQQPALLARFQREAALGKELVHPNIVRTLDFGADRGVHFIALELVEGGDLDGRLKKDGRLPERDALAIVRDVAKGLQHAHERGLVHRDVKPSNIMFDRGGTVKLSDFGLVKDTDPNASSLTQTGAMMGTPFYLAPEQAQNAKDLDIRADLYALGATLYHCVTGRPPHMGETPYEVVVKHINEPLTPPEQLCPALSPGCARIIKRMLAKDPKDRYAQPADVVGEIDRLLRALSAGPARMAPPPAAPPEAFAPTAITPGVKVRAAEPEDLAPQEKRPPPPVVFVFAGMAGALLLFFAIYALRGPREEKTAGANAPPLAPLVPAFSPAPVPPTLPLPEPAPPTPALPAPVPALPVAPPPVESKSEWTDLIPGVNVEQGRISGRWGKGDGELICTEATAGVCAAIEVGAPPAAEYDFRVDFMVAPAQREGFGAGEVCQIFRAGRLQARWALWSNDFKQIGFVWDNAHFIPFQPERSQNPTFKAQPERLKTARLYHALVEVRCDRVRGYLDGNLVSDWTPDAGAANDMQSFTLRTKNRLGVGAFQSVVRFSRIEARAHTP
ncbi:MAG: serine/threonine protein kinase [Planctomycetes bacterium]|nr:serine/threonine protein kinase [Planctomycetota bacterium]